MAAPLQTTYLGRIHKTLCEVLLQALKGTPMLDALGIPIRDAQGHERYELPSPQILREIREFLKDNNIDSEPIEASSIAKIAQLARQYDDDCEPKLIAKETVT